MTGIASTIECRLLCASSCAYGIDDLGNYTAVSPYTEGVGWLNSHPPVAIYGGGENINACLVGVNQDDGIIVAFRGTFLPLPIKRSTIMDWWQDIVDSEPRPETYLPGMIHDGFGNAVDSIWTAVMNKVNDLKTQFPTKPVYLTGHSKGGPMATISAARMHFDPSVTVQPEAVYTFASPHPGNKDFVNNFPLPMIPVFRYENRLDIVPLVPPTQEAINLASKTPRIGKLFKIADGWNYASLGERRYIKKNHEVVYNAPELTKTQFAKLLFTVVAGPCGLRNVAMAHMYTCGNGYMLGTCPTGVCP